MTDTPPRTFSRPTEAPPPLPPLRGDDPIAVQHTTWAAMHVTGPAPSSFRARVRRLVRTGARRVSGQADHALLGELIRAVDVVASRCDELSERLTGQQQLTEELAGSLSEDVTRLRAAVSHIQGGLNPEPKHE